MKRIEAGRGTLQVLRCVASVLACLLAMNAVDAQEGFISTGSGVRTQKTFLFNVKIYQIEHKIRGPLPLRDAKAIINLAQDKLFIITYLRKVSADKVVEAITDNYQKVGYTNWLILEHLWSPVTGDLMENETIRIAYDSASSTISVECKGKTASIIDPNLMIATWEIWFGPGFDQPTLTQALMSNLK